MVRDNTEDEVKNETEEEEEKSCPMSLFHRAVPVRFLPAFLLFLGTFAHYFARVNINIAIIAMTENATSAVGLCAQEEGDNSTGYRLRYSTVQTFCLCMGRPVESGLRYVRTLC